MTLGGGALALLLLMFVHAGSQQQAAEARGDAFVRVHGTHFVHNGKPFFVNGFNAYWLMNLGADNAQRGKVTSALSQAAGAGLSLARTWAFNDGNRSSALQYSPGLYHERTFQGLDFVLSEARKHGIKMILSLVNYYGDYGGRKQYVDWAKKQNQIIPSDDGFFNNPVVKGFYKNHIKDDPTIMAWELMNEPRCESNVTTCRTILQSWITEMAAHVKSIDGNHLLEAGLEGFYGLSPPSRSSVNPPAHDKAGTDFIANNLQVPGIDFATVHSYPDKWLRGVDAQSQLRFQGTWLDAHIADARAGGAAEAPAGG
ncbi:hypothetical protein SORBI_3008G184201 [Sorghum bicolor]|uniref:mannan endo-1,4-beta-mannosidase n=1 Tax=Sorghum bicolor TaxID=4558 RepID=A0A1Z5R8K0_SORBI|nr:hypothetical protein SORBI_3008G184201 [Sorghum bicolor]